MMRRAVLSTGLAALLAFVPLGACAQLVITPQNPNETSAVISTTGSVSRAPDTGTFEVGIMTVDDDSAKAQSQNNAIYEALISREAALGIEASKIKTLFYNVNFNPRPSPAPHPAGAAIVPVVERYGYIVNRQVTITFTHLADAGKIVDAAVAAGATMAGGVQYELGNRAAVYRQALTAAMADAAAQAGAIAAAAHMRVAGIRHIQAGNPIGNVLPNLARFNASAKAGPNPETSLPPENVEVTANVTVTYRLRPVP